MLKLNDREALYLRTELASATREEDGATVDISTSGGSLVVTVSRDGELAQFVASAADMAEYALRLFDCGDRTRELGIGQ